MKKTVILLLAIVFLCGCSIAAHSVKDIDKHIVDIADPKNGSTECIAGFYVGIGINTDNLKISKAVAALDGLVPDKDNAEYKRCKVKGLEVSILAVSSKENLDDILKRIVGLGLF